MIAIGVCKYCKYPKVRYNAKTQLWECHHCHLSSIEDMRVVNGPVIPEDALPEERIYDTLTLPNGKIYRILYYVPKRDEKYIPDLKINVEYAIFMRDLYEDEVAENEAYGEAWMIGQGYEVYDEKRINGRTLKFWHDPGPDEDDEYEDEDEWEDEYIDTSDGSEW